MQALALKNVKEEKKREKIKMYTVLLSFVRTCTVHKYVLLRSLPAPAIFDKTRDFWYETPNTTTVQYTT